MRLAMRAAVAGLRPLVMTSLHDGERQVVLHDDVVDTHVQVQGPRGLGGSVVWYDHRPDGTVWRLDGLPAGGWSAPRRVEWPGRPPSGHSLRDIGRSAPEVGP